MRPSCLPIIALGLCGSCRSPLVLHEGNLGIGSYTCSSTSPAVGASYTAIRGTGLLIGRSGLALGFVDRRRLTIELTAPSAHVSTDIAEVWISSEDAASLASIFPVQDTPKSP